MRPLRFGELLDQTFRNAPRVFKALIPFYLVLVPLQVVSILNDQLAGFMGIFKGIGDLFVYIISISAAALVWRTDEDVKISHAVARNRQSLGLLFFKQIALGFWIGIATFLWALLLVIPGMIYALNRTLAPVIFVVEELPLTECLTRSRDLMKRDYFSSRGPAVRLLGFWLICIPLYAVIIMVAGLAGVSTSGAESLGVSALSTPVAIALAAVASIAQYGVSALWSTFWVGLYYDADARYEGSDIEASITNTVELGRETNTPADSPTTDLPGW